MPAPAHLKKENSQQHSKRTGSDASPQEERNGSSVTMQSQTVSPVKIVDEINDEDEEDDLNLLDVPDMPDSTKHTGIYLLLLTIDCS